LTKQLLSTQEEAELQALWLRRGELDNSGWGRLWRHVTKILNQCQPRILRKLPDTKEEYISDFWMNKVQNGNYGGTPLESARALATFFDNYLKDELRYCARRPTSYLDDEAALDCLADDNEAAAQLASTQDGPEDTAYWSQLLSKAAKFFRTLTEIEQIYLSQSFCPGKDGEPMSKLAERLSIASYHYKAGQLGIVHAGGKVVDDYEKTKIGTWISKTLGLQIERGILEEALEALCEVAMRTLRGSVHA